MPTTTAFAHAPRGRALTITLWILQILAAAAFITAGSFKLIGAPQMVRIFDHIGIGQWFRFVTGTIEVLSGLALLLPAYAAFGAIVLAATMSCAVFTHLAVIGGNPAPAFVLLAITATIAWLRRHQLLAVTGRRQLARG